MNLRFRAIWAVLKRNFQSYFSSPTGYVFITMFVVATGVAAFFGENFFAANIADLAGLNQWMPWLLVVFVPAVTMGLWAEERKLGTHELLLTLPVRDVEVVLGKYLAALAVYTVSLLFSLAHAVVLISLGKPDMGLLFANYVGYWLIGAALIPLGLVASALTSNITVAFILGTALCAAGVFAEKVGMLVFGPASRLAKGLGVPTHFESFTLGVVSVPDVLFFTLLAAAMLYVNMVVVGRRHWWGGRDGPHMGWHQLVRGVAVGIAAISIGLLAGRWLQGARMDATAEDINSAAPQTIEMLKKLPGDQPVYIRAFVSEEVPEDYVAVRQNLLRTLKTIQSSAGDRVIVEINNTEPYSEAAGRAEREYGIKPNPVSERSEGRNRSAEIFLGVAVSSGAQQQVVPFFDRGLSVEYELVRAIRTIGKSERRKVGMLKTEANVMGGMDFRTQSSQPSWPIVDELKKQYEVLEISGDSPITGIDVLLAVQPTGMNPEQEANLTNYLMSGKPVLMFLDPLALSIRSASMMGMMPNMPQDDLAGLLGRIGVRWDKDTVVFDTSDTLVRLPDLPMSYVFISDTVKGFNKDDEITKELSRMVLLCGGALRQVPGVTTTFTPLLQTGTVSGLMGSQDALSMLMQRIKSMPFTPSGKQYAMAARISGSAGKYTPQSADPAAATQPAAPVDSKINAIVVADVDMISEQFFELRKLGDRDLRFDNITFVLNCVDYLAGDENLVALRSHQPKYRPLETLDAKRKQYRETMIDEENKAEEAAKKEQREAQSRFDQMISDISKRTDLDEGQKEQQAEQVRQAEQKRLDARKSEIDSEKAGRVRRARDTMFVGVRKVENSTRQWAILLPALPPILVGLFVFALQQARERRGVPLARSMRKNP